MSTSFLFRGFSDEVVDQGEVVPAAGNRIVKPNSPTVAFDWKV